MASPALIFTFAVLVISVADVSSDPTTTVNPNVKSTATKSSVASVTTQATTKTHTAVNPNVKSTATKSSTASGTKPPEKTTQATTKRNPAVNNVRCTTDCHSHGKCKVGTPPNSKICTCDSGYASTTCKTMIAVTTETPKQPGVFTTVPTVCKRSPCLHQGKCSADKTDSQKYVCDCTGGYNGTTCEIETPCTEKPCQFGATCSGLNATNYACLCASGYNGQNCTDGPCADFLCNNAGICQADSKDETKPLCKCPSGFSGDHCENGVEGLSLSSFSLVGMMLPVLPRLIYN